MTCLNIASSPNTPVTFIVKSGTSLPCSSRQNVYGWWDGGEHGSDVPDFTMNVTGVFGDDAMLRQVTEAVLISITQSSKLINNKNECNHVSIPRAVINYE